MSARRASLLAATTLLVACATPPPADPVEPRPAPLPRPEVSWATGAIETSRSTPLALADVLESVRARHPQQLAAIADQAVAAGRQLTAEGAFDLELRGRASWDPRGTYRNHEVLTLVEQPTTWYGLSVFGGYHLGAGDFAVYDGKRRTSSTGEAIAGVRLPLLRDGWIDPARAGLAQSALDVELSEVALQALRIDLARRAAREYWGWVAAGQRVTVAEALLEVAVSRAAAVRASSERGELAAIEADENDRQVAVRRAFVFAAQRGLEQSALALSMFLRDAAGRPVVPPRAWQPAALPAPTSGYEGPLEGHVARALAQRPEPRRLGLLARRAGVELDLARNQALPTLNLTASVEQELSGGGPSGEGGLEVLGGLEMRFPVQRRAARGREAAAIATRDGLEQQEAFVRDQIGVEVRDAASALAAASSRYEEALRARALAQRLEQAERESLALGHSTLLVVNLREQAAAEANLLMIDAAADHLRAAADWRAAQGE